MITSHDCNTSWSISQSHRVSSDLISSIGKLQRRINRERNPIVETRKRHFLFCASAAQIWTSVMQQAYILSRHNASKISTNDVTVNARGNTPSLGGGESAKEKSHWKASTATEFVLKEKRIDVTAVSAGSESGGVVTRSIGDWKSGIRIILWHLPVYHGNAVPS